MVSGATVGMSPAAFNILWIEIKTEKNSVVQFTAGPAALGSFLDNHYLRLVLVLDAFIYLLDTAALVAANIVNPYPPTTDLTVMSGGPLCVESRVLWGEEGGECLFGDKESTRTIAKSKVFSVLLKVYSSVILSGSPYDLP